MELPTPVASSSRMHHTHGTRAILQVRRNLGATERVVRLALSAGMVAIAIRSDIGSAPALLLYMCATLLALNALSGRCYLWRWLGISPRNRTLGQPACGSGYTDEDASAD